jgi:Glycosyl transferases group 1
MIRALYVDIDLIQINPTANYFPQLIEAAVPNVSFYGPGFSSPDVLAKGLLDWIRETGPYEFIFIGPNSPILASNLDDDVIRRTLRYMRRSTAHRHADAQIVAFLADLFAALPKVDIEHRVANSLNFDYYAATAAQVQRLQDLNLTLIGPNEQFVRPFAELPEFVVQEKHYQRKKAGLSDCWFDFLHAHPERVITALHYVVPSEFSYTPIHLRRPVVAVPGVEYHLRKKANAELRRSGVRMAPKSYFYLFRILNRLGMPVYAHPMGLHMYNQAFQRTLKTSRYVYTAPGGFGLPVRKFFEIPAAGALLLCRPCTGYRELGFVDGVHYLSAEPNDLPDLLQELARTGAGHDVAISGRKVTANKHSLQARAQQIQLCVEALMHGTYRGARWHQGNFVVMEA